MSEFNQKEYVADYHKSHIKRISFNLNTEHDKDILDYLSGLDNKQGYIKALIREDMKKNTK